MKSRWHQQPCKYINSLECENLNSVILQSIHNILSNFIFSFIFFLSYIMQMQRERKSRLHNICIRFFHMINDSHFNLPNTRISFNNLCYMISFYRISFFFLLPFTNIHLQYCANLIVQRIV